MNQTAPAATALHWCPTAPPATAGPPTALGCYDIAPKGSMYADWMVINPNMTPVECGWECVPTPPATATTPAPAPAPAPQMPAP